MALYGKKAGDRTIATAEDLCDYLLDTAGTALVPGTDFGAPDNIRLSYAVSLAHVKDGITRMTEAIAKLR
jgi:aspartate aminotransferase